jgi:hypothetical protein
MYDDSAEPAIDVDATIEDYLLHSETLAEQAEAILTTNDRGGYTVPADNLYPHQWLWDSCFIAIGIRHYDVERAKIELLSLLRGQWRNGMLPNIIFNESSEYKRDRDIWRSWVSPFSPDGVATSGITQPPMLAEAVVQIGEKMNAVERRSWYKMIWPALLDYHLWLYVDRDPHGEGLVLQIHPWETGLDNTPPWMAELHGHLLPFWIRTLEFTKLEKIVGLFRRDTRRVPADQRFSNVEVLALFDAQLRLRRKSYDINKILDHGLFAIEDLTFNCIFIRANEHLRAIAKYIKVEIPKELDESMELSVKSLEELWDPYAQEYFSRDFVTHKLMKVSSIAALMPLYAGSISQERANALVRKMENDHLFGPAYPVPTVPVSSEWFDANRYWQGPSWVNTNWLIIEGLNRYGFKDHAAALRESTLEMVTKGGFYEYFHPLTGKPLGIKDFSWTAALALDLLHKN